MDRYPDDPAYPFRRPQGARRALATASVCFIGALSLAATLSTRRGIDMLEPGEAWDIRVPRPRGWTQVGESADGGETLSFREPGRAGRLLTYRRLVVESGVRELDVCLAQARRRENARAAPATPERSRIGQLTALKLTIPGTGLIVYAAMVNTGGSQKTAYTLELDCPPPLGAADLVLADALADAVRLLPHASQDVLQPL